MNNQELFICECGSHEHQMFVWYDEEFDEIMFYPHLTTHRNFFQRLWYGIKYIFGYKSMYGAWDELLMEKDNAIKLRDFINERYGSE